MRFLCGVCGKVILPVKAAQQIEEALESCEMGNWYATYNEMYVEEALSTIRAARAQEQAEQDLDTCPGCGGVADNGHDREFPPNPYYCTKCTEQAEQEPVGTAGELFTMSALERLDVRPSTKVYLDTAPVQQVDLTDDEILDMLIEQTFKSDEDFARAVIAAYKEKNK